MYMAPRAGPAISIRYDEKSPRLNDLCDVITARGSGQLSDGRLGHCCHGREHLVLVCLAPAVDPADTAEHVDGEAQVSVDGPQPEGADPAVGVVPQVRERLLAHAGDVVRAVLRGELLLGAAELVVVVAAGVRGVLVEERADGGDTAGGPAPEDHAAGDDHRVGLGAVGRGVALYRAEQGGQRGKVDLAAEVLDRLVLVVAGRGRRATGGGGPPGSGCRGAPGGARRAGAGH